MPDPSTELRTGSLRLFVAIELPGEVREALGRLQHELQRRGLEKLRWVRPESIHLTLKFLGETPAEKVPAIEEALSRWANDGPVPREMSLGALGGFGGSRYPRVLWIGLEGDLQSLHALQTRIVTALSEIGFPREARPQVRGALRSLRSDRRCPAAPG